MSEPVNKVLRLRSAGMFSNVNEVVQQLHLAEKSGYRFKIDWSASAYRDEAREDDPWNYYFEDCFSDIHVDENVEVLPGGVEVACTRNNIITPRLEDNRCDPLLLPHDRFLPHRIIKKYIRLKRSVSEVIESFDSSEFEGPTVGLHIRGPGRVHGGVPELRARFGDSDTVPVEEFTAAARAVLRSLPSARVFVCSDSEMIMRTVREKLGDHVISYSSTRSEFGEMHVRDHPENQSLDFDPHKLGQDVLVEAYLLSRTDHLIHGNSNVANFVLSANPTLPHTYVAA